MHSRVVAERRRTGNPEESQEAVAETAEADESHYHRVLFLILSAIISYFHPSPLEKKKKQTKRVGL
jgi:hypothetical protein